MFISTATSVTHKWPLIGVATFVDQQSTVTGKRLAADITLVGSRAVVCFVVVVEARVRFEGFSTVKTKMEELVAMDIQHVIFEPISTEEVDVTEGTAMSTVV